jgi:hypothetical protein
MRIKIASDHIFPSRLKEGEGHMKKFLVWLAIGGGLLVLSSHTVSAQWVSANGPNGGNIRCLAVSGGNIFAGTDGGVYLSTNNGTSWTAVNSGLTNALVIDRKSVV